MTGFLRRLDSPRVPPALALIAYCVFIAARLALHNYDPSYFVTAGDQFSDPDLVPSTLKVLDNSQGYDGQFYYRLALDPFTWKRTDFGITLDSPEYRQGRILYPLLAWILSVGRIDLVPVTMLLVNFVAVCLIGWLGALYARSIDKHALWGLVFPFSAGILLALSRDLTEVLQVCFLLASLLMIRRQRHMVATVFLTLAALTKESTLLVAGAALLVWLCGRWRGRRGEHVTWYFVVIPVVAYSVWQLLLLYRWDRLPLLYASGNIGWPFSGFIFFLLSTAALENDFQWLWLVELGFAITYAVGVLYSLRWTVAHTYEKLSWFLYVAFALLWTRLIWVEDWAFLRHLSEFYLLGAIILIGSPSRIRAPILGCSLVLWLVVFRDVITAR